MLTFENIQNNKKIRSYINRSGEFLKTQSYTDHGIEHAEFVAKRCAHIAHETSQSDDILEYSQIAGFCHDMGNFLSRSNHHYFGAILFEAAVDDEDYSGKTLVMEAISNHDKEEADIANPVTAVVILADKSDVRRSRVIIKDKNEIKKDIHNRVNYAATRTNLHIDAASKSIILALDLDESTTSIMDYFEIFTDRMHYCRIAALYLGYKFKLKINEKELL